MGYRIAMLAAALFVTAACTTPKRPDEVGGDLTVGKVQMTIEEGMSGADVIAALGAPNIVTTDEDRNEVWVYDKLATEQAYSTSNGGLFLLLGAVNQSSGSSATSQRTLTVVIKFDSEKKVRDFSYHSSKF
jgi:outer membrane protein assembly factor BamE (lipoprotein component of BamABCDE complex)